VGFFESLPPESFHHRFFASGFPTSEFFDALCNSTNPRESLTLVVEEEATGRIIAVGSYFASGWDAAEVAFAVEEPSRRQGLASRLFRALAHHGIDHGFRKFWASMMLENTDMLDVFRRSGFQLNEQWTPDEVRAEFSILNP
jgi:RimJ/RimL family protein N-acetyltransferase